MRLMMVTAVSAALLGGCAMNGGGMGGGDAGAIADLVTANGQPAGRATATQTASGIEVMFEGRNLPPGPHGLHVHTTGRCDAPTFETAGGHWNPTGMKHGSQNPAGPHAGDLPNLNVASDGMGRLTFTLPGGTMDGLFDTDGSALMVHAGPDDLRTDPSGNSGGRIACGIFRRG